MFGPIGMVAGFGADPKGFCTLPARAADDRAEEGTVPQGGGTGPVCLRGWSDDLEIAGQIADSGPDAQSFMAWALGEWEGFT